MDREDRGRNHLDSETLAPQEVSRNGACVYVSQARKKPGLQPTEAKRNAKNKHSSMGKDPALLFSA